MQLSEGVILRPAMEGEWGGEVGGARVAGVGEGVGPQEGSQRLPNRTLPA